MQAVIGWEVEDAPERLPVFHTTDNNSHLHTYGHCESPINLTAYRLVGGGQKIQREPVQVEGKHANCTQKGTWPTGGFKPRSFQTSIYKIILIE